MGKKQKPNTPRFGPAEPAQDYRIYNKRKKDGTFPKIAKFFEPDKP